MLMLLGLFSLVRLQCFAEQSYKWQQKRNQVIVVVAMAGTHMYIFLLSNISLRLPTVQCLNMIALYIFVLFLEMFVT